MLRPFRGFTLIELMVALAVFAIAIAIAAPSFQDMIRRNRVATTANDFLGNLNLARSEAVQRGTAVTVCPKNGDGTACDGSGVWGNGWLLGLDSSGSGAPELTEVLRIVDGLDAVELVSAVTYLRFVPSGAAAEVMFNLAAADGSHARCVLVAASGRARVEQGECPL